MYIQTQDDRAARSEEAEQLWNELQCEKYEQDALETITALDTQLMMDEVIETSLRSQLTDNVTNAAAALTLSASPLRNASFGNQSLHAGRDQYPHQSSSQFSFTPYTQPIQLRKLELPVFDGDIAQFHDFWCRFEPPSTTMTICRLQASSSTLTTNALKGSAALIVQGFDPSKPENYHLAIQALKKRYDRPQFTHNLFHHRLEQLPTSSVSASSQRDTLSQIQSYVLQLNRFEDTTTSLSLMKLIKSKFPRDTQLEVNRLEHRSGKKWTLPDLLDGLNEVIEEFEKLDDYSIGKSTIIKISTINPSHLRQNPTYDPNRLLLLWFTSTISPFAVITVCPYRIVASLQELTTYVGSVYIKVTLVPIVDIRNAVAVWETTIAFFATNEILHRRIERIEHAIDAVLRHQILLVATVSPEHRRTSNVVFHLDHRLDTIQTVGSHHRHEDHVDLEDPVDQTIIISPSRNIAARTSTPSRGQVTSVHSVAHSDDDTEPAERYEHLTLSVASDTTLTCAIMTVEASLVNPVTRIRESVTLFLDTGSQTSFITRATVQKFHLAVQEQRMLTTVTFKAIRNTERSEKVFVPLTDVNKNSLMLTLNTTDNITTPTTPIQLSQKDIDTLRSLNIPLDRITEARSILDYLQSLGIRAPLYYVQSENNPEDCASRGPSFLRTPQSQWPQANNIDLSQEHQQDAQQEYQTLVTQAPSSYTSPIRFNAFSRYIKLVRSTAYSTPLTHTSVSEFAAAEVLTHEGTLPRKRVSSQSTTASSLQRSSLFYRTYPLC
ncbi:hypothetical protein OSTOST_04350 [Ostertagia ostertagi]